MLNLVIGHACGHHRPHLSVRGDDEVDDDGAVVDGIGLGDDVIEVLEPFAAQGDGPIRFCHLHEIGDALSAGPGMQVGVGIALPVEQRLPLPHHAQ